jgi:hypothetical protein
MIPAEALYRNLDLLNVWRGTPHLLTKNETLLTMDVDEDDDFYGPGDGAKDNSEQEHEGEQARQSDAKAEDDGLEEGEEEDEEGEDDSDSV